MDYRNSSVKPSFISKHNVLKIKTMKVFSMFISKRKSRDENTPHNINPQNILSTNSLAPKLFFCYDNEHSLKGSEKLVFFTYHPASCSVRLFSVTF